MMSHRFLFYLPELNADAKTVALSGGEHHHLSRVLRVGVGEKVFVTDGRGKMLGCEVLRKGKDLTELAVIGPLPGCGQKREAILALACIKRNSFERAIAQCTELGMTRCLPFHAENSIGKSFSTSYLRRLEKIALSAMKQAFRATLPAIEAPVSFPALLERIEAGGDVVVGMQGAPPLDLELLDELVMVVIGPEGGFSEKEMDLLSKLPCRFASVSTARLRSETASIAFFSLLAGRIQEGNTGRLR